MPPTDTLTRLNGNVMPPDDTLTTDDPYYANLPAYMTEVYDWAYVNPKKVRWLDRNIVVRILLFFNDQRLMRAYLNKIREGMRVWQVAHVYGDLVKRVAEKVGPQGIFHLTDITPIQIEHAERKLADKPWCKVIRKDAAEFAGEEGIDYDLICSFFLLHEVPDEKKCQIVDHMLKKLPKGKEVIFVDYGNPSKWQPIRYILKVVNKLLEPFAEALWKNEISHYASNAEQFVWEKKTFFGGVYQCVIVRHKE
ncbi:MAG: rhodoquinone biosynthesis methyltransferase RquA [Azoarcus sp.]|nr:rhodoquinone biosynthesis methyltransferase RquA [Azoarcus sp.]